MAELNLKNFPDDLHRELKIRAALEGKPMRDLVIEVLEAEASVWAKSKTR
jgi:plasmid stability protein